MCTEVALLGGMVFWIDEYRIVRAGCHACFAADANRFIKIDDAIRPLEHRGCRTRRDTRSMSALVASGYLMRAPNLRKYTYVDMFDIRARNRQRYKVLRLTGRGTGMTADTPRVVNNLCPVD